MEHEKSATWKKWNMEKVQGGNSKSVVRAPRISKMEIFSTIFNDFVHYTCGSLDLCGGLVYPSGNSAT